MAGEGPLLVSTKKGPTLSWRGVEFYPQSDPIEYARRKARVFACEPRTLVFVPSLGLGHGLRELLDRLPTDSFILCVEAFQEVMAVARDVPRDSRLLVARTDDPAVVAETVRRIGALRFRRVRETTLCAGYRLAPDVYRELRAAAEDEITRSWRNKATLMALGSLQIRNILSNVALFPGAAGFDDLATERPVVVAGAGPSLELTMPSLLRARGRYALLAVDTALPCLRAAGLVPDVVVALEAQYANLADFVPGVDPTTLLACDISAHPAVVRLFPGRVCFFSSSFAQLRLFERMARGGILPVTFPALGSVGVAAVHAALRITRATVFLTGLDFSFPGAKSHARGSPWHLAALAATTRIAPPGQDTFRVIVGRGAMPVTAKDGASVLTDRVLRSYRDVLAARIKPEEQRVLDAGPVGLPLGARRVSPQTMEEMLGAGAPGPVLAMPEARPFPAERVRAFLGGEKALLRRALVAPSHSDACAELLEDVRHAWLHFTDEPDPVRPDPGFVARVRVAAGYYLGRIEKTESVL